MKKNTLKYFGMLLLFCGLGVQAFAQANINIPLNTGPTTVTVGGAGFNPVNFFDNGGGAANYSDNSGVNSIVTFVPATAGQKINVNFTAFATETGWDALYIYNGNSVNAAPISVATCNMGPNSAIPGTPRAATIGGFPAGGFQNGDLTGRTVFSTSADGALTFRFRSDAVVNFAGWTATATQVPGCSLVPAANITASTGAADCTANVTTAVPVTSGSCPAGGSIQYTLDGGPAQTVAAGVTSITFNNLSAAVHNIVWSYVAAGCPGATANQTITVADGIAPVVHCPNDIVVTLDPGACSAFVNFAVTATDNCPFLFQQVGFAGQYAPSAWTVGLVNSNGSVNAAGAPGTVVLNGSDNGSGTAGQTNYTHTVQTAGNITFTWTYATGDNAFFDPPGYTVNGVFTSLLAVGVAGTGNVTVPVNVGTVFGFSQRTTDNIFGPGFLTITNFSGPAGAATPPVNQTAGLASGSSFPIGTTTNCFSTMDVAVPPNTGSCCFNVTVNEFPNPSSTLACNDLVQISLDANCSATIGADMVLEGGPYGCYDDYVVMVLSNLGQPLGNVVNDNFIGTQWTIKVTDPATGNSCWGAIIVEDKIKPIVLCEDLDLPCTALSTAVGATANFESNNTPVNILDLATVQATIPVTGIPADARVLDVDVTVDINHTWLGDLDIILESPAGTQAFLWNQDCGGTDNFKVTLDDEDPDCMNLCAAYQGFDTLSPIACLLAQFPGFSNVHFLNVFDGELAPGTWKLVVTDNFGADVGVINNVEISISYFSASAVYQPDVIENCGAYTLSSVDAVIEDECGGPSRTILRTWRATDESGNVSDPCVQTITFIRPTLDDVEPPLDIKWTCDQYNAFPNIINPTPLHRYITDTDAGTVIIDVNLNQVCDDQDLANQDNPNINSTNTVNGGLGCPGNGLDDADVLALTGSGVPTVTGAPLVDICDIGWDVEDHVITICPGTFKILRTWTLVDWCANPVDVREFVQVIKVTDETPPTITAPADLTIDIYNASFPPNAGPHAVCEGTVPVPPATDITDNCSGVASYKTELWTAVGPSNNPQPGVQLASINTNGGLFNNVPLFINGLPAMYIVRYYATDGCGNSASDNMKITLRDKVPPVAVCDEITEVSITNNGIGTGTSCSTLHAESLDDGSYDNCKPVYFLLARMNASVSTTIYNRCYYPTVDFCCNNIGDNTVILLVLDGDPTPFFSNTNSPSLGCNGTPGLFLSPGFTALNYNTCMVTVQVTDKLPPILVSCPPPTRRTCDWYAQNLETQLSGLTAAQQCALLTPYFGEATFYDNCAVNINCSVSINIDQCLEGTISRTWTATDNAGNNGLQSCTQTINIDHVSDWVVEFPVDAIINCGTDVPDFGEPEIFYETCELVAVSYNDVLYTTVPDACYKIARTWTVINWCVVGANIDQEVAEQPENALGLPFPTCDLDGDGDCDGRTFRDSWRSGGAPVENVRPTAASATRSTIPDTDIDSDPWDGYITYEQVIKVHDTVDPVFPNGCQIPDVCILDNSCVATVILPTPDVDDCSTNITITASGQLGNGFGPFFNVAPGTYTVNYNAIDNCNNQKNCSSTITVRDCKKPTPYCKNGLVIELMNTDPAMVQVWASDFNEGSFDNCPGALKISFSSNTSDIGRIYDCEDVGQQPVQIWITDLAGNQDYCETYVVIQANMDQCNDDPQIAGNIATEDNEDVEGVSVNINSPNGFDNTSVTNIAGDFGPVTVPANGDYTISPELDVLPLNGVTTFDLVLISKHILGIDALDTPYRMIAADANKSNSITTFDLVEIRKLILFITTDFPNNTSWRFVEKDFAFANPANPFSAAFPEVINLNNLTVEELAANFVAIKVGDVNGNASVNLLGDTEERNMVGELVLNTDDLNVTEGETYNVEFKATDFNVSGYQFTLNFDKKALELMDVTSGLADASNFGLTMASEGVITTSWNSDAAKRLATGEVVFGLTFKAKQNGRLSDLVNVDSRYTVAEAYDRDNQLLNVGLSFNNTQVSGGFELYQNTPNPFASTTAIGFYLPEATSGTLTVSDVQGKVVKVINGDFTKGYNKVDLKRGELVASGVLYYRLDTKTDSATRKMILVD